MKIRLSGEQIRRLNALVAAHPDELRGLDDAVRVCIESVTNRVYEGAADEKAAFDRQRTEAWEDRKRRATKPVRRPRRRSKPEEGPRPVPRAPRPDLVRELARKISTYEHNPAKPNKAQLEGLARLRDGASSSSSSANDENSPAAKAAAKAEAKAAREAAKAAKDKGGEGARE